MMNRIPGRVVDSGHDPIARDRDWLFSTGASIDFHGGDRAIRGTLASRKNPIAERPACSEFRARTKRGCEKGASIVPRRWTSPHRRGEFDGGGMTDWSRLASSTISLVA